MITLSPFKHFSLSVGNQSLQEEQWDAVVAETSRRHKTLWVEEVLSEARKVLDIEISG